MLEKHAAPGTNEDQRFATIRDAEHRKIEARRQRHERKNKAQVEEFKGTNPNGDNRPVFDTTGVALSGGGIRSAAFCLGVLQSLGARSLIGGIDYLSTVSGGGYIGSSMTACMAEPTGAGAQEFPFGAPLEFEDREAVGHLRDYSNYLLPRGGSSFIDVITVLLRGWAANLVFILGVLLLPAWLMIVAFPDRKVLDTDQNLIVNLVQRALASVNVHVDFASLPIAGDLALLGISGPFAFTRAVVWVLVLLLVGWATMRSLINSQVSDVVGRTIRVVHWTLVVLAVVAAVEAQPLAVWCFFGVVDWFADKDHQSLAQIVKLVSAALAPFSAVIVFFRDRLGSFLKTSASRPGTAVFLQRAGTQAAIWVAALVMPLAIYGVFLWLCAAGMAGGYPLAPWHVDDGRIWVIVVGWISVHRAYFLAWVLFFVLLSAFAPNANSLHRLYRDKLSKAFMFRPAERDGQDLKARDDLKLSKISPDTGGPYQLINAALNLQNSKYANRRGRNATFFLFSSEYVGSDSTGYAPTANFESDDQHLNLGTAMAISGAAVSANMGSNTISALAPTLALLNVRLGYWLVNPRAVRGADLVIPQKTRIALWRRLLSRILKYYLVSEISGNLDEGSPLIYVTDGGHIENLGLYQLLKRGCRAVIVVDAEADPTLSFRALAIVERYARIDLGIRIDLPWEQIGRRQAEKPEPNGDGAVDRPDGAAHCALGIIDYPNGEKGLLLYVKACTTGDESDYVLDYRARYPAFPHESTGDQFFSEEQFEAYRALGFHSLQTFLENKFIWTPADHWRDFQERDPGTGALPAVDADELKKCFLRLLA